ncbi:hypothetical protein SLS55_000418 [Diplodia seriata]|uniref:Uncharacterized protein n=1 Tax=Diplodia seriata TaxID=420778 RepID=A0ABR3CU89_9PEZI
MWTLKSARLSRHVASARYARTSTLSIRLFASHAQLPSEPLSVKVSDAEVNAGKLDWRNVEIATRALHRDGLVVLEGLIRHEKLDKLNRKMVEDAYVLQAMGDDGPFNYNKGNIQQDPPLTKQWWEPSIFVNLLTHHYRIPDPIVTQVTSTTLGPDPRHGGMPNLSKDPRVMLAMIHFAPWYRNPMLVEMANELKPTLSNERTGLQVQGSFMPEEEVEKRYLNRPYGNAYDFSQQQPLEGIF